MEMDKNIIFYMFLVILRHPANLSGKDDVRLRMTIKKSCLIKSDRTTILMKKTNFLFGWDIF